MGYNCQHVVLYGRTLDAVKVRARQAATFERLPQIWYECQRRVVS